MKKYSDVLRRFAKCLDEDFNGNVAEVIDGLLGLAAQLIRQVIRRSS